VEVLVERAGGIATVTLNRPARRNAMSAIITATGIPEVNAMTEGLLERP